MNDSCHCQCIVHSVLNCSLYRNLYVCWSRGSNIIFQFTPFMTATILTGLQIDKTRTADLKALQMFMRPCRLDLHGKHIRMPTGSTAVLREATLVKFQKKRSKKATKLRGMKNRWALFTQSVVYSHQFTNSLLLPVSLSSECQNSSNTELLLL